MRKIDLPVSFVKLFAFFVIPLLIGVAVHAMWKYPASKTVDVADTYFGKIYKDPYRWLENLRDKEVAAWFKAQAELTDSLLAKIPARDALAKEWLALDKLKPARYSVIAYEHGRIFYKKTLGGENVGKLFCREGWSGPEKPLFDPATYNLMKVNYDSGHFTEEKIVTFKNFAGMYAFMLWQTGQADFRPVK